MRGGLCLLVSRAPGPAGLGTTCVPANAGAHEREHRERGPRKVGCYRYGRRVRRILPAALLLAALTLTGCAQDLNLEVTSSPAPSETQAASGAATLEEAAASVDCELVTDTAVKPPATASGSCRPGGDAALAFLWEFENHDAAMAWLDSGALEIGATDAVYVDGAIVLMARDAATAQTFSESGEAYRP